MAARRIKIGGSVFGGWLCRRFQATLHRSLSNSWRRLCETSKILIYQPWQPLLYNKAPLALNTIPQRSSTIRITMQLQIIIALSLSCFCFNIHAIEFIAPKPVERPPIEPQTPHPETSENPIIAPHPGNLTPDPYQLIRPEEDPKKQFSKENEDELEELAKDQFEDQLNDLVCDFSDIPQSCTSSQGKALFRKTKTKPQNPNPQDKLPRVLQKKPPS